MLGEQVSGSRFVFSFINEWKQWFGGYNWTNWNFCLVQFMYENDIILGGYELQVIIFGLGGRVRYNKPIKTKEMLSLEKQVEGIKDGTLETRDWEEIKGELMQGRCPRCWFKIDGSEDNDANSK
jgi:hypothetical protein